MIVVTGAAGFIGSILVKALNARGVKDVLVVDTLGSEGKFKNLRAREFIDIVHPERFAEEFAMGKYTPDAILHIGAITDTSEPDADRLLAANTVYTRTLARIAMERGIRFIYASSASIYGDGSLGFRDDDRLTPQFKPLNPYAFSKWLFDAEAIREGWTNRMVGLRFFNVFGPNEYHKARMASVIWHATNQIRQTGRIQLFQSHRSDYAHGGQRRDFIFVDDVVDVVLWFLDNPSVNGIYNLGTGRARTFNDLAAAIFAALDRAPEIDYVPTPENIRDAYQYFTEADLNKLRQAGCTLPMTELEDAVGEYVRGYLVKPDPYA